ncbi:MAG: hypothetical protein ACRDJW_24625 [Thermomicrobiales bacterium]
MSESQADVYLFLSGAEMHPTGVLAAYPGARFVARARLAAPAVDLAPPFADHIADDGTAEVWGILLRWPDGTADGAPGEVVTDDGRTFQALTTSGLLGGDPQAVLAQARYWELPPPYVARLRDAVAALGASTGDDE